MLSETQRGSGVFISIYDLESGKRFRLDPKHKVAFVADLKAHSDQQQNQIVAKDLKREVQLTGAKHEFRGAAC